MAKRVSRKLLLGLGSTLTFGTIGVVGGFGIKSIVDLTSNNQINQFSIKALAESQFSNAPDYNVATKDMFIDPSNLKRFHFGNTLIGQTVTPYGWLGVFDDPYNGATASTRIALTGWNGEILWVNEPVYESGDRRNYNVYDMEYDFKNDLIFVLRTWSSNGFLNDTNEGFPPIRLDILDAKTGRAYDRSAIKWQTAANTHVLKKWQEKALNGLKNSGYLNWGNQQNRNLYKNLYQLDLASSFDQSNLLLTWMPDFMRLTKNFGNSNASSITLKDFVEMWSKVAVSWIMLPGNISQNKPSEYSVYFDLYKSDEIERDGGTTKVKIGGTLRPADQYYLVANPFFTAGKDGSNAFYIMHILFADKNQNVYHKIIGWDEKKTINDANGILYNSGKYDKTQKIDWKSDSNFGNGGGILVQKGDDKKGTPPSWTNRADYVNPKIINANTRINKNMFDNNSVVFAYPFGSAKYSDSRYPIFNVAQMYVEPTTGFFYGTTDARGDIRKVARQFYFARDIENKNSEMAHYPGARGRNNINQTYHRLISVSPFDNTFIYAERPNINHNFFTQGANDNENKWAGFFVGKVFRNSNDVVRPFFIWNSTEGGSTSGLIDTNMTLFDKLYEDGFTFDLRSFQTSGSGIGLNLYFNQNGNPNGTTNPNGFKSRKIGMLADIFSKIDNNGLGSNKLWIGNLELATKQTLNNSTQFYGLTGTKIDSNSFSTINHSRVDLQKWYPRTLFNNSNPSNLLTGNYLLNNSGSENTRVVPNSFNSKLTGPDFDNTSSTTIKKSIDMVSSWTNSNNYNRLLVKRPEIKVRNESIVNNLPVETKYLFSNNNFLSQNVWINSLSSTNKDRLVFKTTQNLSSASYQIFSSWKEQVRMKSIGTTTNNLNAVENPDIKGSPAWFDRRKSSESNPFGRVNNNLAVNNKRPLRMLLQISKPTGTIPAWFSKINQELFKKYPLAKDAVNGETTFEQILKQFVEEKTRKINLSENSNAAVGLGNLRIDAFMDINPAVITTNDFKIYKNGSKRMVIQNSTGLRIIYEDKYTEPWHQIYDQSQVIYDQFKDGGFGNAVKAAVQTSWVQIPSPTTKLKVSVNADHFQDNLVRKSATEKKILTFEYDNSNNLVITPTDAPWLRSRLFNFQRLINMTPRIEYWTDQSQRWEILSTLSDARMKTLWPNETQKTFSLPTTGVNGRITKLRLKLIPNDVINSNDPNSFVELSGYTDSDTENKFVSAPQEIGVQRIDVNPAWFNNILLENASHSLANLNGSDFRNFEKKIFDNSTTIQSRPELRTKVKLKYRWNNETTLYDNDGIAQLIQERMNAFTSSDQGVFALWNGTTGIKIQAIFTAVDDSVSFTIGNNSNPTTEQLTGNVKSNINNEINLGPYISDLISRPINAVAGSAVGQFSGTTIQFPEKSGNPGSSQFAGKTYDQIKEILAKVEVSIQYKKWQNGTWSAWTNDLSQINTYDPSNPQIKIGFKANSAGKNWNIKLKNNNEDITDSKEFVINLNLPKLVKLPAENKIRELIQKFNEKNVFADNTYKLKVNENNLNAAKTVVSDILKAASTTSGNNNGYNGLENYLELKFSLGNNNQWLDANGLKAFLLTQNNIDQSSNSLKMKIELNPNTLFILEEQLKNYEFELLSDGNSTIKKYIHGTKIEPQLNNITVSGTSNSITYNYPNEIQQIIAGNKLGIKLQYTYDGNLAPNVKSNFKDATTSWTDLTNNSLPTSGIPATVKKIYVRILVTDPNVYVYGPDLDGNKTKGTIDLTNLRDQINVDPSWLNLPFPKTNLEQMNIAKIEEFERSVFDRIQSLTSEQKEKLSIKYYFNNSNNQLDKNGLLSALTSYKNSSTFDILQLWNTRQGVKISATFEKKDANGNYDLIWPNPNQKTEILNTSQVITTIDLTSLVTWLEQVKVNVNKNGQTITSLTFPTIAGAANPFNGKEWTKTEEALELLAIKVQYQEVTANTNANSWNETIDSIRNYDNRAQFRVRFVLEQSKGKNLIVNVRNGEQLIGTDSAERPSGAITVNLAVPKVIQIDDAAINQFRTSNPFSGNTKRIDVNQTKINDLIQSMKNSSLNNQIPSIGSAPLQVEFRFGASGDFKLLDQWKSDLSDMQTDQSTNQIQIKFSIPDANRNDWAVEPNNGTYTVLDADNSTVPIYVHDQGIHNAITTNTLVEGTNDALVIKFPTNNGFTVDNNNYIQGTKGVGLKLQFSLDVNSDVNNDSDWSDARPTKVPAGTNKFFARLVPISNKYVYEKKAENQYTKIQVNFTVVQKLIVDKAWLNEFKLGENKIEISTLDLSKINKWVEQVQTRIKTENNINETIAKKVGIRFSFKGEQNLSAQTLFNKINTERTDFNSVNLGILQLWNGQQGEKIQAEFYAIDSSVLIQDKQGNSLNLAADLLTDNIYTQIDLKKYVEQLQNGITTVNRSNSLPQGQMDSFTPPAMPSGTVQFSGKSYDEIANRLAAVGVKILFKQPGNNGQWVEKNVLKNYDVVTGLLPLAFANGQNTNIDLLINNNTTITPGNNNQDNPINLRLQVPKQFIIDGQIVGNYRNDHGLSGDTKRIRLDQSKLDKLLSELKKHNNVPPNDQTADIKVLFSLNSQGGFEEFNQFESTLASKTTDQTSNRITIKFRVADNQRDKWFIANEDGEYTILAENNNVLKFFINDQNIFKELQEQTRLEGSNTNLRVVWPTGYQVDSNGVLTINPTKGVGLKLEFTFANLDPSQAGNTGSDPQNQWVSSVPTSYNLTNKNLFIRIQVTDSNRYIYEKAPTKPTDKITLSLTSLFQSIEVDGAWLNRPFKNANVNLGSLLVSDFDEYETSVKNAMSLDPESKAKVAIVYSFNGSANLLDKTKLVEEIKKYQASTTDLNKNLGLLKLWNGFAGIKISSTFAKADAAGNYELTWKDTNNKKSDLDLSKIISTFDIKKIVEWLETIRVEITQGNQANSISSIKFKPISASGSPFDSRSWTDFETVLKALDIKIQYQAVYKGSQNNWSEDINSITQYDPSNPIFKVRFVLPINKNKNVNLLVKTNETVSGSAGEDRNSSEITVNLAVPKKIELDQNTINTNFINQQNVISGNTKNLVIDKTKEQSMVQELLKWNQQQNPTATPPFLSAKLTVLYSMGKNPTAIAANDWKPLDVFLQTLANASDDKDSNQINFKFKVDPTQSDLFTIDENQIFTLHSHETPSDTTLIKYFVNKATWEAKAEQITVGGTNNNLVWDFSVLGNIQENNNQIFLRTNSGNALMLQFTTNPNAAFDDDNSKVSNQNNASEIKTKWVKFKPTTLDPNTKIVKVRIVENPGYYYEPAHTSIQADKGSVHNINVNVQIELTVNKQWFLDEPLGGQNLTEINLLDQSKMDDWEAKIYNRIQTTNQNIDLAVAKKILIKYTYKQFNNLSATDLIAKIKADLTNFSGPDLGIVQLAKDGNNSLGEMISATFTTSSQDIIIKDANGGTADLSGKVNTNNIFTKIDLSAYVDNLRKSKTKIQKKPNGAAGEIDGFTLPELSGSGQFANKTYELIAAALKRVGITVEFASELNGPWLAKEAIKSYNVQTAVLYLAFTNQQNNNIKLIIESNGTEIASGSNNKNSPIKLPLNVPKQINIDVTKDQFDQLPRELNFSGDTKNIKFNLQAVSQVIARILKRNSAEANGDPSFNSAPLKMMFQVGGLDFVESDQLVQYLLDQPDDLTDRSIQIKFLIPNENSDEWELSKPNDEYTLHTYDNSPLKIFINDKDIFKDLAKTQFSGTNENLNWNFQNGITVDKANGQLRKIINGKAHGVGLKLAYSFDQTTSWTNQQPSSYDPTKNKVFIRVELEDSKYTYQHLNQVIPLELNLPVNINLKVAWLNQELFTDPSKSIDDFIRDADAILTNYETQVYNAAKAGGIDQSLHNKFAIKYSFDDQTNLLNRQELIAKLKSYKTDKANTNTLGILQLWNQNNGVKIKADFVDANSQDNFVIQKDSQDGHIVNTSKVETTIDFSGVINWLTQVTMKIPIDEGTTANSIVKIKIPPTSGLTGSPFDNREWSLIEAALSNFGITIQYKPDGNVNNANWGNLNSVNAYDPNNGQVQFKFKFKDNRFTNIKLLLINNEQLDGKNPTESSVYKFKLAVKLNLVIDRIKIDQFIQSANISGNTKNIEINETSQQDLIKAIKDANAQINPEFQNVILKVEYYLGDETDTNIQWKEWNQFKTDLSNQTNDQRSNRVIFRLNIDQSQNDKFSVSNAPYVLHNNKVSAEQWTVKYFINKANLENNAGNIKVKGTSSNVMWNYDVFGTSNIDKQQQPDNTNKVFIKNIHGQRMLQVLFSTNPTIAYDSPESDNLNDITTKWTTIEPIKFLDEWNVSKLYVKLVPVVGYVYEAQENKTATRHEISLANLKLEIKVNPDNLATALNLTTGKKYLHELNEANINEFVKKAISTIAINGDKVDVQFKFRNKFLSAQKLFTEIQTALNIQNGIPKNIVQLWNGTSGEKIEAKFILKDSAKDQYILIDSQNNQANADRLVTVVTSNIKSLINIKEIISDLSRLKIDVTLPNQTTYDLVPLDHLTMPSIPAGTSSELQGLSWQEFENKLATFGVAIQARPKVKSGIPEKAWTSINNIKEYDDNLLSLELRFKINPSKGQNIVLSVKQDGDVESTTTEDQLPIFEMSLKAPAKVVVNNDLLTTFINSEIFRGDTKHLEIVSNQPEATLIKAIIDENVKNNPTIFSELTGRLEVQYYLGKNNPTSQNVSWYSAEGLKDFLSKQTKDQTTNQIWFRLNIKNSDDSNAQVFQVDQSAKVLSPEQINATAKIKIYINETGFSAEINKLKAVGSTDNFVVNGLDDWKTKVPQGLEVGYSKENDPDEANETQWSQTLPTILTSDKKLWIRFKVLDGYVYEAAKQGQPNYGQKHQVDTTGIKVIIKLKTEWLEKILIDGNTKKATINEQNVLNEIINAGVLPTDQPDLIQLEYNIKGSAEWFTKSAFESKLDQLNGAKDVTNFILKRDDLQIRFNIRKTNRNDSYGLNIDNENVTESNYGKFNRDIVAAGRNDDFKGYINLDHLKDFVASNFKIIGSTTKPKLIITKRQELNQLFMPYASDNLFDIQFSTVQNRDGSWDWSATNQSILSGGQLINEDGLITQGITIGAEKHFAIKFISKDSKYDVYKANNLETDGYLLDLSSNVKITVEIINPFTAEGKTLGLWTRENAAGKNNGKYYQGQGGFKITVANKNTFIVENNGQQSAQEFLKTTTNLTDVEKNALELVFHVFGSNPSDTEIEKVEKSISNYQDTDTWKSFDSIRENPNSDWSKSLDLKVGDYVAVALRVKEQFATQENPFILKDDDYSMILPVMKDNSGITVKPGRLSGYKVKTDLIDIQKGNVIVANMISSQLPPLDGWTELQRVSLQSDELDNYLGVDLKVQVYTEFHEKNNHILFSGNNTKLVKRTTSQENSNVEDKGNYKDEANQDIVDKDGVHVKIYKDKTTKRLSAPKKNASVTKEKLMTNLGGGSFRFDPDADSYERGRLSLFRNQDVDLLVVANKGEGTEELPDFYLDKEDKTISLREQISPQIKFPVENEKKISYAWNYEQFAPDQIEYKSTNNNPNPEDGSAQISTIYKLIKKEGTSSDVEEITGNSPDEAFKKIEQKLKDDFDGQLRFETVYQTNKGSQTISKDSNIYNFKNLSNKDRIVVKIVSVEEDLFYVSEDQPLVINVNGLTEKAPNKNRLQYLRVKQGGLIDGQGSFKVLVSNPENDNEDDQSILNGWKFLIRVWDKDKDEQGNWQIKIPWSDDPARIKGLANGDRVEWKLVSSDGNPVKDAYYNTIALDHDQKPNGEIDYKFAEVNYPNGQTAYKVVKDGIGAYPQNDDQYPENSGFVISGLQPTFEVFKIGQEAFELVLKQLNPTYVGFNNQGTINFNDQYLEGDYWVNTKGEIYLKDQSQAKLSNEIEELAEIPIKEFIDNITFFTEDPILVPYQNGFKFSGNDININNHLANGNHVWAQFNMIGFNENEPNSAVSSNGNISSITLQLADVSGLKNTSDPMSPFWYVLIALAGIVTLGTSSIIAYFVARNKKLKGKN